MSLRFNWPSREEWAKQRTSVDGHQNPNPPSNQLSDYATADEITGAIAALNKVWGDYGREMKSDKAEGGHRYDDFRWYRCGINEAIKELREGKMPRWRKPDTGIEVPPSPLDTIMARYQGAKDAAQARWVAEVAARPVDDAAWEAELQWRRECDARWGQ